MKAVYLAAALVAFQFASAQKTQELKDFINVAIKGDIQMKLVKSNTNKAVYEAGDDELTIEQDGNSVVFDGDGMVTLYYKGELEGIAAGADTQVAGSDEIKGKSFNLAAAADSQVSLKLNVQSLMLAAGSDAQVSIKGKTKEMTVTIGSDAELDAKDFVAEDAMVTIGSDGHAEIQVKGAVTATVGSDGQLTIYGNPKKVNETKGSDAEITLVK